MRNRVSGRKERGFLLRRWWLVLPLTLLGGAGGYVVTTQIEPVYQAKASILVGRPLLDPTLTQEDIETSSQLASAYADVAERQPVLGATVRELGLDVTWQVLGEQVSANVSGERSQVVVVTVSAPSGEESTSIAAEVVDQIIAISPTGSDASPAFHSPRGFIGSRLRSIEGDIEQLERENDILRERMGQRTGPQARQTRIRIAANDALILDLQQAYASLLAFVEASKTSNQVEVLEEPEASAEPVWPRMPMNVAIGAMAGFLLGLAIAHLLTGRRVTIAVDAPILLPDARPAEPNHASSDDAGKEADDPPRRPDGGAGETAASLFAPPSPRAL